MKKYYKSPKRRGLRLKGFDYNQNGLYFVTICTKNRIPYFGISVYNEGTGTNETDLTNVNESGEDPSMNRKVTQQIFPSQTPKSIAEHIWKLIPVQFPFVRLLNFVVMPDHVHGIIGIKKDDGVGINHAINRMTTTNDWVTRNYPATTTTNKEEPPSQNNATTRQGGFAGHHNPMLHQSLSTIIRWYKGRSSYEIRKFVPGFAWQSLFYEHIIEDREDL